MALLVVLFVAGAAAQTSAAAGRIAGQVVSTDRGMPVASAVVILQPVGIEGATTRTVTADRQGRFAFAGLAAGKYWLRAERAGFVGGGWSRAAPHSITLAAGQQQGNVLVKLQPGGVIAGTVSDANGVPVQGLRVFAYLPRYQPDGRRTLAPAGSHLVTTDDRGYFRIFGLEAGEYLVAAGGAVATGYGPPVHYPTVFYPDATAADQAQPVVVYAGEESDVSFSLGLPGTHAIRGFVSGASGYTNLIVRSAGDGRLGGNQYFARSGPNGAFVVPSVPDGRYVIAARTFHYDRGAAKGSYELGGQAIVTVAGQDANVTIALGPLGEVRGQVTGAEPSGIIRLTNGSTEPTPAVYLRPLDAGARFGRLTHGKSGDGFDFRDLSPGDYVFGSTSTRQYVAGVECNGLDYTGQPLPVAVGVSFTCRIALAPANGSILGTVSSDGQPVPDRIVVALPDSPLLRVLPGRVRTTTSDAQGRFQLGFLPPGDYWLFAVPPDPQQLYFAPDFPTRHAGEGQSVSIGADPDAPLAVTLAPLPEP